MKILKRALIVILILLVVFMVGMGVMMSNAKKDADTIEISGIDISATADGTYNGTYETPVVKARVKVTVKDKKITEIVIEEHQNGMGTKAEQIATQVIAAQRTDIAPISGATLSSKVILKAIENALKA